MTDRSLLLAGAYLWPERVPRIFLSVKRVEGAHFRRPEPMVFWHKLRSRLRIQGTNIVSTHDSPCRVYCPCGAAACFTPVPPPGEFLLRFCQRHAGWQVRLALWLANARRVHLHPVEHLQRCCRRRHQHHGADHPKSHLLTPSPNARSLSSLRRDVKSGMEAGCRGARRATLS